MEYDLLDNFESIIDGVNRTRKNNYVNQIDFFGEIEKDGESIKIEKSGRTPTKKELLEMEKEMLGLYISGHPLDEYKEYINKNATVTSVQINLEDNEDEEDSVDYDGKNEVMCGIFHKGKLLVTKSGRNMMFATLEDMYGDIELVIFPNIYEKYLKELVDENVLRVTGKISLKEDEKPKLIVSNILNITNINDNANKKVIDSKENIKKIYIRIPKDKFDLEDRVIGYIKELSKEYHGDNEVYIFYDGTNKLRLLNKKDFLVDSNEVIEKLVLAFGKENVKIK